jgi:hypothetical protein
MGALLHQVVAVFPQHHLRRRAARFCRADVNNRFAHNQTPQYLDLARKRFFLKEEAKPFALLSPTQQRKSFLVLFFEKELLPY